MKTVVIVHHTGEWGGGTKSLIDLCEMLRNDYNVVVCIPRGFPDFINKIVKYGCCVHEMSVSVPFINLYSGRPPLISVITLRSLKSLRHIRRIGDEILALKPDVVIFNSLVTAVTARYLSRFTKVICIDRETLTSFFSKILYRKLLDKHLDAITFLAHCEREKLEFRQTKTLLFPDCVKPETLIKAERDAVRKKEGIEPDKYVILFMGGLSKLKGTDVMLRAVDLLDERFVLVFAGAMNEEKLSKRQMVHDIKYPGQYLFKKRVKKYWYKLKGSSKLHEAGLRDSIDELIVASDAVAFPSTSVHQPRPCIEAGAYGKPVIISGYNETSEYFKNKYNALTFKPGDSHDFARKIRYAYLHQDEMEKMGVNNRLMTETKHNYYDCKRIICNIIEKVCKNED